MYLENLYKFINRIFIKKSKETITSFSEKIINRMDFLIQIKNASTHFVLWGKKKKYSLSAFGEKR
jgi:hypothetical protein